ncbi:MAG: hypothetical protein ACI8XV_002672 [Arenicella sp.]|jgi:hypothetical protein
MSMDGRYRRIAGANSRVLKQETDLTLAASLMFELS